MAAKELPENFHETSVIMEIPLAQIRIDRSYQRDPSQTLVDTIAGNWDEVASELVLVSDRGERPEESDVEGGLWLVNGQHRSLAARKRGHETIWARVVDLSHLDDPAAVEAELRLKLNVKLGDRPLERFKAQVRAGDEDSLGLVKILEQVGTQVNEQTDMDYGVNAIATFEAIYGIDDGALLRESLELIRDAFGGLTGRKVGAATIKAVGWFIEKHGPQTDRSRVVERLGEIGIEALHRRALTMQSTMGGSTWMNYYRVMVEVYNDKLHQKSRLDWTMKNINRFAVRKTVTGNGPGWAGMEHTGGGNEHTRGGGGHN